MEWGTYIAPSEIASFKTLFSNLSNQPILNFVVRMLNGVSRFIGYPVTIAIPTDVAEFSNQHEHLRALRILKRLRDTKIIKSFQFEANMYPDEPSGHVALVHLADIERFGFSGKGAHLSDKSAALWPALGEAVERYATQFHYPKKGEFQDASWNELKGTRADIFSIAGFDTALRASEHEKFTFAYDRDTEFRWVKATEVLRKREVWAPLQWFSFSHVQKFVHKDGSRGNKTQEPLLSVPITTGAATGQSATDATLRGLLEVIERDAFIIYWLNQLPAKRINPLSFKEARFEKLQDLANRYQLEIHPLYFETDMPVHTVCSVVIDRSGHGPALIVGAKSGFVLSDVVFDAFGETLAQRGLYRRMMEFNKEKGHSFEDISKIDHVGRMLYWFDGDRLKGIEKFLSGKTVDADTLPAYAYTDGAEENLQKLLQTFADKGYEVYARELLNDKLKRLTEGLSVMMVKVPQMQPVYLDESLRSLGGERLRSVPKMLGYDFEGDREYFCAMPHPFP